MDWEKKWADHGSTTNEKKNCTMVQNSKSFAFPQAWEWVNEPASKWSAAKRERKASIVEQANECAVQVNELADKRMAQYSTRLFLYQTTLCARFVYK